MALLNEQYAGSPDHRTCLASWHQFSVASHLRIIDMLSGSPLKIAAKPSKNISISSFKHTFRHGKGLAKMTAIFTLCLRGTIAELSALRHQEVSVPLRP